MSFAVNGGAPMWGAALADAMIARSRSVMVPTRLEIQSLTSGVVGAQLVLPGVFDLVQDLYYAVGERLAQVLRELVVQTAGQQNIQGGDLPVGALDLPFQVGGGDRRHPFFEPDTGVRGGGRERRGHCCTTTAVRFKIM